MYAHHVTLCRLVGGCNCHFSCALLKSPLQPPSREAGLRWQYYRASDRAACAAWQCRPMSMMSACCRSAEKRAAGCSVEDDSCYIETGYPRNSLCAASTAVACCQWTACTWGGPVPGPAPCRTLPGVPPAPGVEPVSRQWPQTRAVNRAWRWRFRRSCSDVSPFQSALNANGSSKLSLNGPVAVPC